MLNWLRRLLWRKHNPIIGMELYTVSGKRRLVGKITSVKGDTITFQEVKRA